MSLLNNSSMAEELTGKTGEILTQDNRLYISVIMEAIRHKIDPDSTDAETEAEITAVIDVWSPEYIQGMMLSLAMMLHRFHTHEGISKELTNVYSALEVILLEKLGGNNL